MSRTAKRPSNSKEVMKGEMLSGSSGLAGPMGVQLELIQVAMDGIEAVVARLKTSEREFPSCGCKVVVVSLSLYAP